MRETIPMDREEAIAWLRSVGRNASARDWVMGKTIVITIGEPTTHGEITVYPSAVYVYPAMNGAWNLYEPGLLDPAETYDSLESAVRGAHEYVGRKEAARKERE
jgi:hypothetical protein